MRFGRDPRTGALYALTGSSLHAAVTEHGNNATSSARRAPAFPPSSPMMRLMPRASSDNTSPRHRALFGALSDGRSREPSPPSRPSPSSSMWQVSRSTLSAVLRDAQMLGGDVAHSSQLGRRLPGLRPARVRHDAAMRRWTAAQAPRAQRSVLRGILDADGRHLIDPHRSAKDLCGHWRRVFRGQPLVERLHSR